MAYADIDAADASMASTIASTLQQMSLSFGLAAASLVTVFFLADLPQSDHAAVTRALHHGYLTMAAPHAGLVAGVLGAAQERRRERQQGHAGAASG